MVKSIIRKMKEIVKRAATPILRGRAKTKCDEMKWRNVAQAGEFEWHATNNWRQTSRFMEDSIKLFNSFGFAQTDYKGKTIIDLGAGSKLRTKYFEQANIIAIEPLANKFMKEIEWCDLTDAQEVYSSPAEVKIKECLRRADLLISINVLDHCFNFEMIIENIAAYLTKDGMAFLSFDQQGDCDQMHPLKLNASICEKIFLAKGLAIKEKSEGMGGAPFGYGHGKNCLNYKLMKA